MDGKEIKKKEEMSGGVERSSAKTVYRPDVDILETADEVLVIADMPGVDWQSLNIVVEDDILSIEGVVAPRERDAKYRPGILEYGVGNYERRFRITSGVDASAAQAKMKDGVLSVTLPKAQKAKRRVVAIEGEETG